MAKTPRKDPAKKPTRFIISESTPPAILKVYSDAADSLIRLTAQLPRKAVVVTSCSPGEGKSTTCLNIARAAAMSGTRTLLIDADMRRPSQHTLAEVPISPGLSEVLSGNADHRLPPLHSGIIPGLSLLTAGKIPRRPAELLAGDITGKLLAAAQEGFGLILIDTPPANAVTDAFQFNTVSAGILAVLREGASTHKALQKLLEGAKLSGGNVLAVFRAAELHSFPNAEL